MGPLEPHAPASAARPRRAGRDAATLHKQRIRAGEMFDQDMCRAEVAEALGESMATVSRWFQVWCDQGAPGLAGMRLSRRRNVLTDAQLAAVEAALLAGPQANGFATYGWSAERVAAVIERVTGVRCSPGTTWAVLRERLGWTPLSTWVKPAAHHNGLTGPAAFVPFARDHGEPADTSPEPKESRGDDGCPVTPECPLTCLSPLVSARVYHRILEARPEPQTVADVITLYQDERLSRVRNLGRLGIAEIGAALAAAGLIHAHAPNT